MNPTNALYAEIRGLLGADVSTGDALRFAGEIVRFYVLRKQRIRRAERQLRTEENPPFELLPVDIAMEDGGWKILEYEVDQLRPEIEIGRVQIYDAAALASARIYAAEAEKIAAESERVMRALDWLLDARGRRRDDSLADDE